MVKKFLLAAMCAALAAPALADSKSHIGVSYMGSTRSTFTDMGDREDTGYDPKGIRAVFHIQTPNYFFWTMEGDYVSDSADNLLKEEITNAKIKFGGRIPAGEQWAFSPYLGGVKHEFRESDAEYDGPDDVISDTALLLGLGVDFQPIEALTLTAHAERADMGEYVLTEAGLAAYWNFTPALAVGGGMRHRNFDFDVEPGDEFSIDLTYVDLGLRISF